MRDRNIHIEKLQVRLPRSAMNSAQRIAGELGREILRKIAETTREQAGTRRIDEISAGNIKASANSKPETWHSGLAEQVAKAVKGTE